MHKINENVHEGDVVVVIDVENNDVKVDVVAVIEVKHVEDYDGVIVAILVTRDVHDRNVIDQVIVDYYV